MRMARRKRPRDPNQLAHLIVQLSTGQAIEQNPPTPERTPQPLSEEGSAASRVALPGSPKFPLDDAPKSPKTLLSRGGGVKGHLETSHVLKTYPDHKRTEALPCILPGIPGRPFGIK